MRKPPTILDVASLAGVSKSTVSNVIQGKASVDELIKERVFAAIKQLDYKPNAGARYMRQRSKVLGVVVGDLTNPFHAELAAFVESHAANRSHSILLVSTGGVHEREVAGVRTLIEHRVAAVIFLSSPSEKTFRLLDDGLPKVFIGLAMPEGLSVSIDEWAGSHLAVQHLASLGHRNIGFVSAMLADEPLIEKVRFQGYRDGMAAAGLPLVKTHLLREQGRRLHPQGEYQKLLIDFLSGPNRPTAIVTALDRIAIEVISAADNVGLRIPEDLSVVGFDDIAIAGHSRIALTTIAQPMSELARIGVDAAIEGQLPVLDGIRQSSIMLPPRLVERRTTGEPSQQ